jgi:hypothetical protein
MLPFSVDGVVRQGPLSHDMDGHIGVAKQPEISLSLGPSVIYRGPSVAAMATVD